MKKLFLTFFIFLAVFICHCQQRQRSWQSTRLLIVSSRHRHLTNIDCLSQFCHVPAASASLNSQQAYFLFLFLFLLLRPLTVLLKQTRQAVHAVKQSIFLRCLWFKDSNRAPARRQWQRNSCFYRKVCYQDTQAAIFCHQLAAWVPDMFWKFYLVKKYKIANNSTMIGARKK